MEASLYNSQKIHVVLSKNSKNMQQTRVLWKNSCQCQAKDSHGQILVLAKLQMTKNQQFFRFMEFAKQLITGKIFKILIFNIFLIFMLNGFTHIPLIQAKPLKMQDSLLTIKKNRLSMKLCKEQKIKNRNH